LNETLFRSLMHARLELEAWRTDYNRRRPHGKLGWLTPVDYARQWARKEELEGRPSWAFDGDRIPSPRWMSDGGHVRRKAAEAIAA